jgi:hypothetical protein
MARKSLQNLMWPVIWIILFILIACPKKNKPEEFVPRTYDGLDGLDEDEFPEDSGLIDEPLED